MQDGANYEEGQPKSLETNSPIVLYTVFFVALVNHLVQDGIIRWYRSIRYFFAALVDDLVQDVIIRRYLSTFYNNFIVFVYDGLYGCFVRLEIFRLSY